jgi:hypothetical protein
LNAPLVRFTGRANASDDAPGIALSLADQSRDDPQVCWKCSVDCWEMRTSDWFNELVCREIGVAANGIQIALARSALAAALEQLVRRHPIFYSL